ncbi:hypothetical protein ACFL2S_11685 [Thermodesulfobacteriota bacterium]
MEKPENIKSNVEQAAEDMFNYAIDRQDVKRLIILISLKSVWIST